ncbi:MAG: hypothetical protein IT319_22535 [Anaerolineae bacterium]|nr:hypothetical protein [Anaerolineae bacterium]
MTMTVDEIIDEFEKLSLDEKRQVLDYLRASIRKKQQAQAQAVVEGSNGTNNPGNSADVATPSVGR